MNGHIDFDDLTLAEKEKYCRGKDADLPLEYDGNLVFRFYHQTLFRDNEVYFCGIYATAQDEELFLIFSSEISANKLYRKYKLVDCIQRKEGDRDFFFSGSYSNNLINAGYNYINSSCLDMLYFSGINYKILKALKKEVVNLLPSIQIYSEWIDYPSAYTLYTTYGLTINAENTVLANKTINYNVIYINYDVKASVNEFVIVSENEDISAKGKTLAETVENFILIREQSSKRNI
jgi:hypothetical protein